MAKGNPFGNKGGTWMTNQKLRALFHAGLTFDEIAEANERATGWRPDRSVVKRKYDALGMPSRNTRHTDLIPWKNIKPEHRSSELRYMLEAESRKRQGKQLSDSDRRLVRLLHQALFGRSQFVVGYHPEVGFGLYPREDYDEDIIRDPRATRYADDGIAEKAAHRRAEEELQAAGLDTGNDDASPQRRRSGTG